jgi:hypothetical protein
MNIGGVGAGNLPVAVNASVDSGNPVQAAASVTVLKKAEDVQADTARKLIASATGVGQTLDVHA